MTLHAQIASRIYKTKEESETIGKGCKSGYITTIKIEWEE